MSARSRMLAVTVLVATYNRARLLRDCLEALAAQVVPDEIGWEAVIVDNNSTDDTRAVVAEVAFRTGAPIRYLFEPRQGKSHALNAGAAVARGGVLALTDDDVIPASDWVATAAAVLDRWEADGAGGRIMPFWAVAPPRWLAESRRLRDRLALMEHDRVALLALPIGSAPQVWGANMVVRASALAALGGFNPGLGPVGSKRYCDEDVDIVRRLLASGRVVYDPALTVHHQIPRARLRRAYFRRIEWQAGEGQALAGGSPDGPLLMGAPRWRFRHVVAQLGRWLVGAARRSPDAIEEEMDFFHAAGNLWGHAKRVRRARGAAPAAVPEPASLTERVP